VKVFGQREILLQRDILWSKGKHLTKEKFFVFEQREMHYSKILHVTLNTNARGNH